MVNKTYKLFYDIKRRCFDERHPYYKDYGGRGIGICKKWLDDPNEFNKWALENDYGERMEKVEIDRIDNNKGYSPKNCRFVNRLINANNRRRAKTELVWPEGVTKTRSNKFHARYRRILLGNWNTPEEAAKQYECVKRIHKILLVHFYNQECR